MSTEATYSTHDHVPTSVPPVKPKFKIYRLLQGTVCHCVKRFILVNSLRCVSEQEEQKEQMLGLLKYTVSRRNTEKFPQSVIDH